MPEQRLAAIDVGTNSILLLVVEVRADGCLFPVEERCRIERLGQGLERTGRLDDKAISRALDALVEYARIIRARDVSEAVAVGTQALRQATNASELLDRAESALGISVEVIDGRREAELVYGAAIRSLPQLGDSRPNGLTVFDVGGGSTEIIAGRADGTIDGLASLPIGAVRLT
ncbi:MAG: hypothetical protein V2A73_19645, partial [Pseudomonadota bacterium]